MSDDGQRGQEPPEPEPTADECVRAGMYWFGRSDFQAAQAWWERAVEIDPRNTRAQECLRLLTKTSSTGFKNDEVNPFEDAAGQPADQPTPSGFTPSPAGSGFSPVPSPPASNPGLTPHSSDLGVAPQDPHSPPVIMGPNSGGAYTPAPEPAAAPAGAVATDPFDFAVHAQHRRPSGAGGGSPPPVGSTKSPWDEGPSRTSVVTLHDSGGFDAVPEPTPLPEIDRERFFGRGDPESTEEIVSFLRATGDLPTPAPSSGSYPAPSSGSHPAPSSGSHPAPPMSSAAADLSMPSIPATPAPPPPPPPAEPETQSGEILFTDPVELAAEPAEPPPDPKTILKEARDRFGLHDFDGVLDRIDALPPNLQQGEEVRNLAAEARRNLLKMYESKIGDFESIPRVIISDEEVIWLNLNHRAGFILSQIDGTVTFEDLVSLSGMPRLDTVRILADLIDKKVVG